MSSVINKYIDIDSTYRNRTFYPLQSNFVIPVYFNTKALSVFQAKDPVFLGYPIAINKTAVGVLPTDTFVIGPDCSPTDNVYTNSYFENGSLTLAPTYTKIIDYDGATKTITLENSIAVLTNPISIRPQLPQVRDVLTVAGSTTVSVILGNSASNQSGSYDGYMLRFVTLGGLPSTVYTYIKNYNGLTKTAILNSPLPSAPVVGDIYELIQYSYDNFNCLLYNGTTTMTQPVCYSIELLYITIPNVKVKNGNGGFLDNYPYFYVKLYNENANSSNHILYSNNPNTNFATFKVPMTLVLRNEVYFTLRDSKCVQVIKFSPDQDIHFEITLPNGEPLVLDTPDFNSPNAPNPFLQISASFAIRRID